MGLFPITLFPKNREKKTKELLDKLKISRNEEYSIVIEREYTITNTETIIELPYKAEHLLIDNAGSTSSDIEVKINFRAPDAEYVGVPANSGLPLENIKQGMMNFKAYTPNTGETSHIKVMAIRLD